MYLSSVQRLQSLGPEIHLATVRAQDYSVFKPGLCPYSLRLGEAESLRGGSAVDFNSLSREDFSPS